jgi:hypothetical protein
MAAFAERWRRLTHGVRGCDRSRRLGTSTRFERVLRCGISKRLCPLRVIHDRGDRCHAPMRVRFGPKADEPLVMQEIWTVTGLTSPVRYRKIQVFKREQSEGRSSTPLAHGRGIHLAALLKSVCAIVQPSIGLRPTMLASTTRAVGPSDDKWQPPEVINLTFDSRRNLAACLGAPNHDHAHALLPSLLIQREAMRQTSDATDATRISSRSPMCLTPAVVIRSE